MRSLALPQDGTAGIRLVLYFTKGLGDVVAAEVAGLVPGAAIQLAGDRFGVLALTAAEAERLGRQARTVDDARLLVAGPERIAGVAGFAALCAAAAARVREVLPPDGGHLPGPWSVTVSARSPVWRRPGGWDPAPVLARHFPGADLSATERSPVDLRLQADGDTAHIALNLWSRPIGKRTGDGPGRGGDGPGRAGALRPTVAAALVRLAISGAGPDLLARGVYDPFCGTGTIAAEAAHLGLPVFASDIDERAVELTRQRLAAVLAGSAPGAAGVLRHRVFTSDVRRGPAQRVSGGIVAGNMPWGKQVRVDGRLALFDATALLARHLLRDGGTAVLLTTHEDPLVARLRRQGLEVTSRRIGLLGQTPAIVVASPG
jgi:predicted RNA methylase